MTESRKRPPEENTPGKILKRFEEHPPRLKEDILEPHELPRWVKTALVFKEILGEPYVDAAARFKKAGGTLSEYAQKSPAAKKWIEGLRKFADSPEQMAQALIRSHQIDFTLDYMVLLQEAIEFKDHALAEKMLSKLMTSGGSLKSERAAPTGPTTLVLQMGSTSFDIPIVSTEVKALPRPGDEAPTIDAEILE